MYSTEQRKAAIDLLIQYDLQYSKVITKLGYPSFRELKRWYHRFLETHSYAPLPLGRERYTAEEKQFAVNYFMEHGQNISRTCRKLEYPSRMLLSKWIIEAHPERKSACTKSKPLVHLDQDQKESAVLDYCFRPGSAKEVAEKYGVDRGTLYLWKRELLSEGSPLKMSKKRIIVNTGAKKVEDLIHEVQSLSAEAEELRNQIYRLKLEKDALKTAAEIIKKDQGISLETLTNREKAMVIDVLRPMYSLEELLLILKIAKSSYCYQKRALSAPDKYEDVREKLRASFTKSYESYGYRRMHLCVKKPDGSNYSEKVIRRLMKEEHLVVIHTKRRKYSSYQGEISPAVENLLKRDFHANKPNVKWLTDITEFRIPAGKIYLSPIIDCYDGFPVAWTIGTSPNAELVNTMLDAAIETLKPGEHPIIHSDRGAHYRWPGWIDKMNKAGLIRSMSKKGCSPDNSACEGFFGRLKNEMFYDRSWSNISLERFIRILDQYIHWYAEKRIKVSLGGLSPMQYRQVQGIAA